MPFLLCGAGALLFLGLGISGCITKVITAAAGFDTRPITIQTVSFFNQKVNSRLSKQSWNGDWIFRRDRLDLIDKLLRNIKPDVLLMQEVLAKKGSGAESDRNILLAGGLDDYEWFDQPVREFDDTQEVESLGVAVAPPIKIVNNDQIERAFWLIGGDGYLMAATVDLDGEPIVVFNVQMPQGQGQTYLWYTFLEERISEWLSHAQTCRKRIIIGGFLPGDQDSKRFNDLMRRLQLKDASAGSCQLASNCYTATSINEIFMATVGDETPVQSDRILLHQSAIVYSSGRNFTENDVDNRYVRDFGLTRLWPTQRFGWGVSARLARCGHEGKAVEPVQ